MGKAIQTKFSNVSTQIIKNKRETRKVARVKRKLKNVLAHKVLPTKIPKLSTEIPKRSQDVPNEYGSEKVSVEGSGTDVYLQIGDGNTGSLFMDDELRNCFSNYTWEDFYHHIFEEIALEGLDGITIEDLWKRLSDTLEGPLFLDEGVKEFIWNIIISHDGCQLFELPEPREILCLPDNLKNHFDLGIIMDMEVGISDIYPHKMVLYKDVQGSCATFEDRVDITETMKSASLKEALLKYGRKLVIVANQVMRNATLRHDSADPAIILGNFEYCILERIGRSRRLGEHTQGPCSINSSMNSDGKSTFHHMKLLLLHNFITKQFFFAKLLLKNQITMGKLLHLTRYYKRFKPPILMTLENIVETLKKRPSMMMAKSEIPNYRNVRKFIQHYDANKYIKIDAVSTYADIYPDAEEEDRRLVQCIQLLDPNVNISSVWFRQYEGDEDEDVNNEDDEEGDEPKGISEGPIYNMDLLRGVYYHIAQTGHDGCSVNEIGNLLGMTKMHVRISLRKLMKMDVIKTYNHDKGRQRMMKYCLKSIEDTQFLEDSQVLPLVEGPVSKLKLKILEKQKEAIQKRKLEEAEMKQNYVESLNSRITHSDCQKVVDLDTCNVPTVNCDFLVGMFRRVVEDGFTLYSTPSLTLVRNSGLLIGFKNFEDLSVDFMKILRQLEPQLSGAKASNNMKDAIARSSNFSQIMKLVLLKAHFNELAINAESLKGNSRKRKRTDSDGFSFEQLKVVDMMRKRDPKLRYMGDNPQTVLHKTEDGLDIQIVESTKPKMYQYDELYLDDTISRRVTSRCQMVLDFVYAKKFIEDIFTVVMYIRAAEKNQGYTELIDRRSLYRILSNLVEEGYVKIIQVTIANSELSKTQVFICHPSITYTSTVVDTACKQLKWKYFVGTSKCQVKVPKEKIKEKLKNFSPFKQDDVIESIVKLQSLKTMDTTKDLKPVSSAISARLYGFKPKFSRMRVLHEFMFYLIYEFPVNSTPLPKSQVDELFESYGIKLSEEALQELPDVYSNEISWKTFVPPLPVHKAWPTGWALMCDILLRLPISVFCRINFLGYDCDELKEILCHHVKRFYLIKDLSQSLRNFVLFERRYMFRLSESVSRLAFCGLVQYGPRKFKDKDQVFIYLNRKATLLDTTTSDPHYNVVTEKQYEKVPFYFNSMSDLDNYWRKMYSLAIATPLNTRQPGQLVIYKGTDHNPSLKNAIRSKTIKEALDDDNGDIPGDNRGAAGLDSSLWCHLIRNWVWTKKTNKMGLNLDMPIPSLGLKTDVISKFKNVVSIDDLDKLAINKLHMLKKHRIQKNDGVKKKHNKKKDKPFPTRVTSKQMITRRLPPRFKKKREKIDKVDMMLSKKLGLRRVSFNEEELHFMLLLKIGDAYLSQNRGWKQVIPYSVLRDIMHGMLPVSRDKTSRAVCRGIKKVLARNRSIIYEGVYNLMNDRKIQTYYRILLEKFGRSVGRGLQLPDDHLWSLYIFIMAYIVQNENKLFQKSHSNIEYLTAENLEKDDAFVEVVEASSVHCKNPESEDEIKKEVVQNVIFCSILCRGEQDLGLKLYAIYDKYSEELLRESFNIIREKRLISMKKHQMKRETLLNQNLFRIHQAYLFAQSSTFHTVTAEMAYKTLLSYLLVEPQLDFSAASAKEKHYGQLLGVNECFSFWNRVQIDITLPEKTVILNPDIEDHSELVEQLAIRMQMKLKKADREQTEAEQQDENDNDNDRPHQGEVDAAVEPVEEVEQLQEDMDDNDLAVDNTGGTIDRLKHWVTDCMEAEKERRSPSPEFMEYQEGRNGTAENGRNNTNLIESNTEASDEFEVQRNALKIKPERGIPSLEQIKEEMMRSSDSNEPRLVPHITELSDLLDQFPEIKTPDEDITRLKKHFQNKYPTIEHAHVDDVEEFKNFYLTDFLINNRRFNSIWERVRKDAVVPDMCSTINVQAVITNEGGNKDDVAFTNDLLEFIKSKKAVGAISSEIKKKFLVKKTNMTLLRIMDLLIKHGVVLRTGVIQLTFVYYKFRNPWVIDTYVTNDKSSDIEIQLRNKLDIQALLMPWTKLDGSLSEDTFKTWLCNVLSVCLDFPKVMFTKICQQFKYLKPVDIFYLLEVLEEMGCVSMFKYGAQENSPFCEWEPPNESPVDFLTDLNDIFVETNNISMTILGSFFHKARDFH